MANDSKENENSNKTASAKESAQKVRAQLEEQANKLPPLPKETRETVAKAYPWLAGVAGLIGLAWAKDLWDAIRAINEVEESLGELGSLFSAAIESQVDTTSLWIVLVMLLLSVGLTITAFAFGATKATRRSWTFLLYAALATVVTGIVMFIFASGISGSRELITLVTGLLGTYLVFQIKPHYKN